MDRIVTTEQERLLAPEVAARDEFIKREAEKLRPGSWVLDAGAGASKYRPFFKHCRYQTQDFCKYEGKTVQYLEPIDYVCDIVNIPLPDASLDAIVCTEVFEHVVNPPLVLKEFSRLLKPGGKLLLTAPAMSYLHMEPYHFHSGFTRFWYAHWLPEMGFKQLYLGSTGGPARAFIVFLQALLQEWRNREPEMRPVRRLASKIFRAPLHRASTGILPRLIQPLDARLGHDRVCFNHLVLAEKL